MAVIPKAVASWGLLSQAGTYFVPEPGDPVKIGLLKTLEARLAEIPELGSVQRWEDLPADLSGYTLPALFFWEEEEKEVQNRLALGALDFWLQVFFALDPDDPADYTAFSETAETVAARIANLFAAPGELRSAGLIQAGAGRVYKAKHNENYGSLFMSWRLDYGHARQDAFSLTL